MIILAQDHVQTALVSFYKHSSISGVDFKFKIETQIRGELQEYVKKFKNTLSQFQNKKLIFHTS